MKLNLYLEIDSGRIKNIFFATGTRVYREIVGKNKASLIKLGPRDIKHLLAAVKNLRKGGTKT